MTVEPSRPSILDAAARQRRRALAGRAAVVALVCVAVLIAAAAAASLRAARLRDRDAAFLAECRAASAAGDWHRLERTAAAWTAASPGAAAAWLSRAEAAVALGRPAEAAAHLARVPDDDPRAVPALVAQVDLLFVDVGRPFEAVETCERILRIDPRRRDAHERLAFFYAVTLQRTRLAAQARRMLEAGCDTPETFVYLVGSQWLTLSNTEAMNEGWLRHDPDNELFLVAAGCGVPDIVDDAPPSAPPPGAGPADAGPAGDPAPGRLARLARLLERFPQNRELLAVFLQQASTRGDVDEVVRLLARAPADAVADCRFWRFKGWAHAARGEFAAAESALRGALDIEPFDHASQHQLAGVLRKTGRPDAAARLAELAEDGRRLRRDILQQPTIRSIDPRLLAALATYAAGCGQEDVAARLRRVLNRPPRPAP